MSPGEIPHLDAFHAIYSVADLMVQVPATASEPYRRGESNAGSNYCRERGQQRT
jgi:hypothetical protein